mmetsp:Transcript_29419/g.43425  ORF Transcript_29419/g.43425 Transcript_29419/m.43425 type:complete len:182 (+) Transcript_29419:1170-1715(+)
MAENPRPPASVGTDTQVDFIFVNNRNGEKPRKSKPLGGTGIVPRELKVSWNFPCGSTTSSRADYARLGRDVKLYDFLPSRPTVDSLADEIKDTLPERRLMQNPHEGEDEQLITSLQAPAIATTTTAEGGEANSFNPANSNVPGNMKCTMMCSLFVRSFHTCSLIKLGTGYCRQDIDLTLSN